MTSEERIKKAAYAYFGQGDSIDSLVPTLVAMMNPAIRDAEDEARCEGWLEAQATFADLWEHYGGTNMAHVGTEIRSIACPYPEEKL